MANAPSLVFSHHCLHPAFNIYNFLGSSWWEWLYESHPRWFFLRKLLWYILQALRTKSKYRPLCLMKSCFLMKSCCQYDFMRKHDYMIHWPFSHPKTAWFLLQSKCDNYVWVMRQFWIFSIYFPNFCKIEVMHPAERYSVVGHSC